MIVEFYLFFYFYTDSTASLSLPHVVSSSFKLKANIWENIRELLIQTVEGSRIVENKSSFRNPFTESDNEKGKNFSTKKYFHNVKK